MTKKFLSGAAICLFAVSISLLSCNNNAAKTASGPAFNLDSAKAVIAASNKIYGECFTTGDSVKFVSCYTADACINPPNMPRMCGTQAISAFFNGGIKMGIRDCKITTDEVMGSEAALAETGKYELMGDKGMSLDKGKFIVVWKMENGKWKMQHDVWNSDLPQPAEKK